MTTAGENSMKWESERFARLYMPTWRGRPDSDA
jgi:hypothetical protein